MRAEQQHILEMVAQGKLSPADADRLLKEMRRPRTPIIGWLFHPLAHLSTHVALAIAGLVAVVQLLISRLDVRFDGALDSHSAGVKDVSWADSLLDLAVAMPVTALVLWGVSRLFARQGRFVDFVAAVGLARPPLFLATALQLIARPYFPDLSGAIDPARLNHPIIIAASLLSLPLFAWSVALLVTGLRTASGLRGLKLVAASLVALFGATLVGELILYLF